MIRTLAAVLAAAISVALSAHPALAEGPAASELPAPAAPPSAESCARLTPEALSAVDASLASLSSSAEDFLGARGDGAYPGAMKRALEQFTASREKMQSLRTWLSETGLLSPHVSNTTGAYNVAGYSREAIGMLDLGRHWASVATAYDRAPEGRSLLAESAKVHATLANLEADGLSCYVSAYVP